MSRCAFPLGVVDRWLQWMLALVLFAPSVRAMPPEQVEPQRVLVVAEERGQLLVRLLENELRALGFVPLLRAREKSLPAQGGSLKLVGVRAVLHIREDGTAVDVWIRDRSSRENLLRRAGTLVAQGESEGACRLLAIQTAELVRASLFEVRVASQERRRSAKQNTGRLKRLPVRPSVGFLGGVGAHSGPGGVGVSGNGMIGLHWSPSSWLRASVVGSVPVLSPQLDAPEGVLSLRESLLQLGASWLMLSHTRRLRPHWGGALGVQHTSVRARSALGLNPEKRTRWRFLTRTELGLTWKVSRAWGVDVAGWMGLAPEQLILRFDERVVATRGPLLIGGDLKILVWF